MDVPQSLASTFVHPYYALMTDGLHLDMLGLLGDAIEWFNEVVFDFLKTAVHELVQVRPVHSSVAKKTSLLAQVFPIEEEVREIVRHMGPTLLVYAQIQLLQLSKSGSS